MPDDTPTKSRDSIARALLGADVWPSEGVLSPMLHEHMRALGVLITNYNSLEVCLYFFFYHYLGDRAAIAGQFIFSKLNNQNRIDVIERYVRLEQDPEVKKRLDYFLAAHSVCTENRNFLAHAQLHWRSALSDLLTENHLASKGNRAVFKKPPRKAPERDNFVSTR